MTEIVVGVDASEGAGEALRWAVREGALRGWSVTAVMGWGYLEQRPVPTGLEDDHAERESIELLHQIVHDAVGDVAAPAVKCVAAWDLPAHALLHAAEGAELLVVGARGLNGFKGLLLGSVSLRCLHHATRPIAVVRQSAGDAPHGHGRVVAAFDGSEPSRRALRWAADEARLRDARLDVVHAWAPPYLSAYPLITGNFDRAVIEQSARRVLDELLASEDLADLVVTPVLRFGSASDVILQQAADADLVVMGARGLGGFARTLLGSVTSQVTQHATTPVVVIPPATLAG